MGTVKINQEIAEFISAVGLVDHHTHGVMAANPTVEQFANMITESDRQPDSLEQAMNSQVGFAARKWCAPILDLPAHVGAAEYFARRIELGSDEVNRRLLTAAGASHTLIETGYRGDEIHGPAKMAELSGAPVSEVIRLETVAERLIDGGGVTARNFASLFREALASAAQNAVGLKSIVAYRYGLDFEPSAPTDAEIVTAMDALLKRGGAARIDDPVLLRFLIFAGLELKLPMQFHIGYGDPDLQLDRCDPLLMTQFLKVVEPSGTPILLLHTYPFQRNAGYLAQMFRNVYMDVGLAINYTGARSEAIIGESLELAPFHKILFSSDAWGLAELTYLGCQQFRYGLTRILSSWIDQDLWSVNDAKSVVEQIAFVNSNRAYGLK